MGVENKIQNKLSDAARAKTDVASDVIISRSWPFCCLTA